MLDLLALQTSNVAHQTSLGGEDRNRTYPDPAHAGPTTVLKTARATRHPSLSNNLTTQRRDLICCAMLSKSGHSPVSSLECSSSLLRRTSNAPPLDGTSLGSIPAV